MSKKSVSKQKLIQTIEELKAKKFEEFKYTQEEYMESEDQVNDRIRELMAVGMDPSNSWRPYLLPLGKLPSPVRIPCWMFRKYPISILNIEGDAKKVALAHAIHFTNPQCHTGYMPLSGNVENWCKISCDEVDEIFNELERDGLVSGRVLDPEDCYNHKRNKGYTANIELLHQLLSLFKMDVWS